MNPSAFKINTCLNLIHIKRLGNSSKIWKIEYINMDNNYMKNDETKYLKIIQFKNMKKQLSIDKNNKYKNNNINTN